MIRLAAILALTACGAPFALRAPKTSAQLAAEAQAHCRSLAVRRTGWTVASSVLGAASGGASPIVQAIPAADATDRTLVTVGGVVVGIVAAACVALATADAVAFESSCALAARPASSGSAAP